MRVRIVKPSGKYNVGQVLDVPRKLAYKLIRSGVAILSKDMTQTDYKTKGIK